MPARAPTRASNSKSKHFCTSTTSAVPRSAARPVPTRAAAPPPKPSPRTSGGPAEGIDDRAPYPEIARLRSEMRRLVTRYPPGVEPLPPGPPINGNGFFPGANGLHIATLRVLPPMPVGKIMILGHNYDVRRNYDAFHARGGENYRKVATWRTLLDKVFPGVGIDPEECFYTNFYMGLMCDEREDGEEVLNTDPFPGADYDWFVESCVEFLIEQIRIIQPRLVIVLGTYTPSKVTDAFVRSDLWRGRETYKAIDAGDRGVLRDVEVVGTGLAPTFVSVVHPCMRHANLRHRSYRGREGEPAEILMLQDALRFSGLG